MNPVLEALLDGVQPDPHAAEAFMAEVMTGGVEQIDLAATLTAFRFSGVTAPTLAAFARAIRAEMVAVSSPGPLLDTCGTGGSGLDTANTSTMAAFVAAAAGVRVAKHGNRSSSGRCGSSDLLEALGIPLELPPDRAPEMLEMHGLVFLYAPAYHPAFRHVGRVRKQLGFRTVFNLLGPLCNPAGATRQLLGVSDPSVAPLLAQTLQQLGSDRVLVVHGSDGLDELTLTGATEGWGLLEGTIDPQHLGLDLHDAAALRGGDVSTNVQIFNRVMAGEGGPHGQLVRLNAAAALLVGDRVPDLGAGVALADDLLRSGAARGCFERYRSAA